MQIRSGLTIVRTTCSDCRGNAARGFRSRRPCCSTQDQTRSGSCRKRTCRRGQRQRTDRRWCSQQPGPESPWQGPTSNPKQKPQLRAPTQPTCSTSYSTSSTTNSDSREAKFDVASPASDVVPFLLAYCQRERKSYALPTAWRQTGPASRLAARRLRLAVWSLPTGPCRSPRARHASGSRIENSSEVGWQCGVATAAAPSSPRCRLTIPLHRRRFCEQDRAAARTERRGCRVRSHRIADGSD